MGSVRHPLLAVAGVALAACGAAAIVLGVTAQTPPQPPSAGSDGLMSVVYSIEPDPSQRPAVEDSSPSVPEAFEPPFSLPSSEPIAIDIPTIGVHSEMQQVGLTSEQTLEVPAPGPYYDDAAWYKHSVTPGAVGPAIVVGHVDSAANGPSVFFDLGNLSRGDEVRITRRDGTVAIFTVDSVRRYPKDDFPTQVVYGETDHAALRLITCGGTFDSAERSYRDNIVVFATLVGSRQASPSS